MGLQCSRQGRLEDFYSYDKDSKRPAPEGQCLPVALTSPNLRSFTCKPRTLQDMKEIVRVLEKQKSSSSSSPPSPNFKMKERREDILIGEECTSFMENKFVDLPPERKADINNKNNSSFLKRTINNIDGSYVVELPPEESHCESLVESDDADCFTNTHNILLKQTKSNESLLSKDQISLDIKDNKSSSDHSSPSENDWSYTLYDFPEKGITTKKDLQQLMDSVCAVMDKSSCDVTCRKESKGHSLNVQLTVTSQNCCKANTIKSPNKYTPSKHYKGMIFPPPNTAEAEKVSCYIEERLSQGRERHSSRNENQCCKNKRNRHERYSIDTCKCPKRTDKLYTIPKRKNLSEGDDKRFSSEFHTNVDDRPHRHSSKSNTSFSPVSLSGSNTPKSCDGDIMNNASEIISHRKHTAATSLQNKTRHYRSDDNKSRHYHSDDNSSHIRLRHSCSCHQRLKQKSKPLEMSGLVDSESNLCKQIKSSHRDTVSSDTSSTTSKSSQNSLSSIELPINNTSSTKLKNLRSVCRSPRPLSKRNSHEKDDPSSSVRPEVWPGECVKAEEIPIKPTTKTTETTDSLCLCKRMLGLDYPCNHGKTQRPTYKHEHHHHHYHYYVPHSTQ